MRYNTAGTFIVNLLFGGFACMFSIQAMAADVPPPADRVKPQLYATGFGCNGQWE